MLPPAGSANRHGAARSRYFASVRLNAEFFHLPKLPLLKYRTVFSSGTVVLARSPSRCSAGVAESHVEQCRLGLPHAPARLKRMSGSRFGMRVLLTRDPSELVSRRDLPRQHQLRDLLVFGGLYRHRHF